MRNRSIFQGQSQDSRDCDKTGCRCPYHKRTISDSVRWHVQQCLRVVVSVICIGYIFLIWQQGPGLTTEEEYWTPILSTETDEHRCVFENRIETKKNVCVV